MAMQWVARRAALLTGRHWLQLQSLVAFSSSPSLMAPFARASPASSCPSSSWVTQPELCGRGDKKTKRGKRFKGSHGNARPKLKKKIERIKDKLEVPRSTPWPLPFKLI